MRIKADFIVTPAAHTRLIELGHKYMPRMNGREGWGISVEVPEGMFICIDPGSAQHASRWILRAKTIHTLWIEPRWNTVTESIEPAHAECWEYGLGDRVGEKVGYLPSWTEEDCM